MFAPPGGRFPPNLPPLFFSTASPFLLFQAAFGLTLAVMQMPAKLESLFTPGVTDVMFLGAEYCYLDTPEGIQRVKSPFQSGSELSQMLIECALEAGSRLDLAKPLADFGLSNYRFSVQLKSAIAEIPIATIRRHPKTRITLEHLIESGLLNTEQAQFISDGLKNSKTFLISGPTSAGKTTLLGAMIRASGQRVVAIEQTPELAIDPPSVRLLERPNNQQGVGLISQSELLATSLRMRPDRIAIGEVRGAEFLALLQAANNGHPALGTIHARKITDLPARLLTLGQLSGMYQELIPNLCSAIDYILHLENIQGRRKLVGIFRFTERGFGVSEVAV